MKDEVDFLLNKSMSVALQQIRNLFLDLVIEEIDFPGGNGTNWSSKENEIGLNMVLNPPPHLSGFY